MKNAEDAPNALVDAFVVGFNGRVPSFFESDGASITTALHRVEHKGKITTPKSKRRIGYERVTFPLATEAEEPAGSLSMDIYAYQEGSDLVLGDRCSIQGNGMLMLRGQLGPGKCGEPGFGDAMNVVASGMPTQVVAAVQLLLLEQAVRYALDALEAIFPQWKPGKLWLKRAEACRDIAVQDAIAAARVLQHATFSGSTQRKLDLYRRLGSVEASVGPTLRFIANASSPECKIYPKRADTIRIEVACRSRGDFKGLVDTKQVEPKAEEARDLFLDFLSASEIRLDQLEEYVRSVMVSEASIGSLLAALKPLVGRMLGERKTKGPVSPEAQLIAQNAVEALLSGGMFNASGTLRRHAIRRELDALSTVDGPLQKHQRWAIYYLKPHLARACAVMRLPVQP